MKCNKSCQKRKTLIVSEENASCVLCFILRIQLRFAKITRFVYNTDVSFTPRDPKGAYL